MRTATTHDALTPRGPHQQGLKVHLREVNVGSYTYRVITLRPSTTARFSTNYYHDTWHLLSDGEGALVLSRLLWGLAFQRLPGTVVLIDSAHLLPTPFEADPSQPILLMPAELTAFDPKQLRALHKQLHKPGQGRTIRWHTFEMPLALAEERHASTCVHTERRHEQTLARVSQAAGFICLTLPRSQLREEACSIARLANARNTNYVQLAHGRLPLYWPEGEVQIFRHFRSMVSTAIGARARSLGSNTKIATQEQRIAIIDRARSDQIRLHAARLGGGRRHKTSKVPE
jgi:hypothetical protein